MTKSVGHRGWTSDLLEQALKGRWINKNGIEKLNLTNVAVNKASCENDHTLFIAIDEKRWHEGTGNRGVYAGWTDTHKTLPKFKEKVSATIVEKEILALDKPQFKVENSYDAIRQLGKYARDRLTGKVIAVTGTVGKSSTRTMIAHLLEKSGSVVQTKGNHNTRTGVPLTLARCISDPDYCVVEVAISALWMRSGGICNLVRPHIGIVTEVGLGQVGGVNDELSTAKMKARVCQGIVPGGVAILNRDMNYFDVVIKEVENFGAKPLTYGFDQDSDIFVSKWEPTERGSQVTANVKGQYISYELPLPGEGMISNSLAAIATLYALGLDLKEHVEGFCNVKLKESVLEYIEKETADGKVTILDDTYNSTMISMKAALEVFKRQSATCGKRKIGILGRVVNLGEHAEKMHRELAKDILDVGFDKVYLHGEEMKYVLDELPSDLVGGYFEDSYEMGHAVANALKADDFILMKGSRRGTDFGNIRKHLLYAIDHPATVERVDKHSYIDSKHLVAVYDVDQKKVIYEVGDIHSDLYSMKQGLGPILLLSHFLNELAAENIKLEDKVKISSNAVIKSHNSLGLTQGQEVTIFELLNAILIKNSVDAVLALAEGLHGSRNETHNVVRRVVKGLGLDTKIVENLSGRKMKSKDQCYTGEELIRVSEVLFKRLPYYRKLISLEGYMFGSSYETIETNLYAKKEIECGYFFGDHKNATVLYKYEDKEYIITVLQADDAFHRDYLIREGINHIQKSCMPEIQESADLQVIHIEADAKDTVTINLIGDTYFGEYYTDRRVKKGRQDALTKYGYDYSFIGIKPLLDQGDFNIANFEAALTTVKETTLSGIKPFTLKGDPGQTIKALRNAKIHAVSLGNNHAMDYGVKGLRDTIHSFEKAGICHFGAGRSSSEAEKPLRLKVKGKTLVFISGYWFRKYMYEKFDFYAMPGNAGVACLSSAIQKVIADEKKRYKDSFIVVLPHWGVDFGSVKKEQREIADKLISCGADLIIGHGAHMQQTIEKVNGKYVIYSIGNGVFNSDGEYDIRKVPPISYFVKLLVGANGEIKVELHPLYSNNKKTFWQPRLLTQEELNDFKSVFTQNEVDFDGEKLSILIEKSKSN